MNIRFYNARILTMEEGKGIFLGEVWVSGDRIIYVGESEVRTEIIFQTMDIPIVLWDREIDCEGNLLMPGFKDAHTHSGMTLLRSYADDMPLSDWLNQQIFPVEALLTAEEIKVLTKLAVLEYLTSGITAAFDMYLTPPSISEAFDDMGFRGVQVGAVNNFSQSPELVEEWFQNLNNQSPLQSFILGFHAEYTCSKELLEKIADLAHRYQAPVFTHLCETKGEVDGCIERYGKTPVAFLDELGMFDYGGGGYHLVHVSDADIEVLKKRHMTVISNPGSNTKLASGIAPISRYLKEKIPVALGTDGPASNNCLDMFREMFLVTGLAKLREDDAAAVDAMEVLKMATVNGARAMGLKDSDVIAKGKLADLILIDLNQPNMQPLNNIAKNLVYSGSKSNVKLTMVGGRILYENGSFFTSDQPSEIYRQANAIISEKKQRLAEHK